MRLALIQTKQNELHDFERDVPLQTDKIEHWQKAIVEQNYRLIETVAHERCDLIVTTEAINFCGRPQWIGSGWRQYLRDTQQEMQRRLSALAKQANSYLVVGVYRCVGEDIVHNSAIIYDRTGAEMAVYDKMHLPGEENDYITPGEKTLCFDVDGCKVGVCICWDAQFPETHRMLALAGAHLVVCPTWGWESIYGHARAYENGIYVAAAMGIPFRSPIEGIRTPSEVVAPDGTVLARASFDQPEALICDFDPMAQRELWRMRMSGRKTACYASLLGKEAAGEKA